MNSFNSWEELAGEILGVVTLSYDDGTSEEVQLTLGANVREWREANDVVPTVNTTTDDRVGEVYREAPDGTRDRPCSISSS